ncbi:hypothetical protein AURDEDRAFT_156030 [Auricularia subglabra TFB-10046 SS5]|nr:hypothetical protein AURDEDRAFT_156030 [Auricularia subglabra TFB-10046 SS5]
MSPASDTVRCTKCRSELNIDEFPLKLTANADGTARNKQCYGCLRREKPAGDKENIDPRATSAVSDKRPKQPGIAPKASGGQLRITEMEDFLAYLREQTGVLELECRVRATGLLTEQETRRSIADKVAKAIWCETEYRFIYETAYESKTQPLTRFSYSCAQNADRKAKPQKHADPAKQRDKIPLDTFDCHGWLHISVSDASDVVFVKLSHKKDHVHYSCIDIPPDVLDLVANGGDLTVSQLWAQILEKHPCPNFTRKSIHNLWAKRDALKWKRHEDQLKSAEILLEEGKKKGGLGMYAVQPLDLQPEPGFEALAWSLPAMIGQWGGRVREVALDSAWETNSRRFELYALLGEAYGSALPLGFLLLSNNGGAAGGTQRCLEKFIAHFTEKLDNIIFTHTDKNLPEINAFRAKVRLAILRRQPAFYNVKAACAEFSWIDPTFLPLAQLVIVIIRVRGRLLGRTRFSDSSRPAPKGHPG